MRTRPPLRSSVGIDDLAAYIPELYLPIGELAAERGIDPDKLRLGLGLERMALPDQDEDAATMAANAVRTLMERNGLAPGNVGRIYLGTESALDGAKPTATYVLEMLRGVYREAHGPACFDRCDVIDMTFACVGGVDALLNTADWVRSGEGRVGIVVASDFAKYELGSTGEYTQGAGAVAMLVRDNPKLLTLQPGVGVATRGVHDFFKPGRADTPTFDGPYSNDMYQARVRDAYAHYVELVDQPADEQPLFTWSRIVMHLPYAAHGRRMLTELFVAELARQGIWGEVAEASRLGPQPHAQDFDTEADYLAAQRAYLKAVGKSSAYKDFVSQQLAGGARASSAVGNVYAASVFLSLMSTLAHAEEHAQQLAGKTIGVLSYGSGSKSKVFSCALRGTWDVRVRRWKLFEGLERRHAVDYDTYLKLHRGELDAPVRAPKQRFALERISDAPNKEGARYYRWVA